MVLDRSFAIYLCGGVLSAGIDVGIFQSLLMLDASLLVATSAGFFISLLFNYLFHAKYTFGAKAHGASFTRYLVVVAGNYLLTLGLVNLAYSLIGNPLVGKLIALPVIALVGYFAGKHWIFK